MREKTRVARAVTRDSDLPLFAAAAARRFLTISELNDLVKGTLETRLEPLWVQGEVSNLRMPPWPADDRCTDYSNDFSLERDQIRAVASWAATGAREGNASAAAAPLPALAGGLSRVDTSLRMREPYRVSQAPDRPGQRQVRQVCAGDEQQAADRP